MRIIGVFSNLKLYTMNELKTYENFYIMDYSRMLLRGHQSPQIVEATDKTPLKFESYREAQEYRDQMPEGHYEIKKIGSRV